MPHLATDDGVKLLRGHRRPSPYELVDKMKTITAPTPVITGDEDRPWLEPGHPDEEEHRNRRAGRDAQCRLQHQSGGSGRFQCPRAGAVSGGRPGTWPARDSRAMAGSILAK